MKLIITTPRITKIFERNIIIVVKANAINAKINEYLSVIFIF